MSQIPGQPTPVENERLSRQTTDHSCEVAGGARGTASSRGLRMLPFVSLLLLGVAVVGGCQRGPRDESTAVTQAPPAKPAFDPPVVQPREQTGFVGSQVCAECHADLADHFSHHPMGRSLAKVLEASPLEDYESNTSFVTPRPPKSAVTTEYHVKRDDEQVLHCEVLKSADGTVIYEKQVPVAYAVGSGQRGRSYLIEQEGIMLMSPVTWYTQSSRWDLSPGYEGRNHHFNRRIVDGCLSCHAGRMDSLPGSPDRFGEVAFLEESIGCERCHGPGEAHVHFQHGELKLETDPIINPGNLTPAQRDHVCFQCHLVGEHRLTRYGRSEYDFRPGDEVSDIWTIFLRGTGIGNDQTTAAVSQVEQMLSSTCYQKSAGAMGCVSCHDPHQTPPVATRVEYFNGKCQQCHHADEQPASGIQAALCSLPREERLQVSASDSCIQCHMPSIPANDVPHTSQTDHRILRSPRAQQIVSREAKSTVYIFGDEEGKIPQKELERGQAISIIRTAESTGNAVLAADAIPILEQWVAVVPDDVDAQISLGTAYSLLHENRLALETWQAALKQHPEHEYLLRRLMVLCHESELFEEGVEYGQRLTKINRWDYEYFGRLAHMLGRLERFEESVQAALRALELDPSVVRLHQWLAEVYEILDQPKQARHHAEQYLLKSATRQ